MKDYDFILKSFVHKHSEIDNLHYLDRYINFLINYKSEDSDEYTEIHHILPRSTFPEFENENWNLVNLKYEHHRIVHLWLFKSINERAYQKPLNFMMKEYKNSDEVSKAAKRGWIKLKNNKEKYEKWRDKKSEFMTSLSSEEQKRRANIFWSNLSDSEYLEFCDKIKGYWTDEKKNQKSIEMKNFYTNEENREKKRNESNLVWKNRDEDFRANFRNKMEGINKNEEKRKDAGEKIKILWKSEEYLNKMKKRKLRRGVNLKLIHISGEEFVIESMRKFKETYDFSEYLIRKYRNTNKFISIEDLKESNIDLKNYKIETIDG